MNKEKITRKIVDIILPKTYKKAEGLHDIISVLMDSGNDGFIMDFFLLMADHKEIIDKKDILEENLKEKKIELQSFEDDYDKRNLIIDDLKKELIDSNKVVGLDVINKNISKLATLVKSRLKSQEKLNKDFEHLKPKNWIKNQKKYLKEEETKEEYLNISSIQSSEISDLIEKILVSQKKLNNIEFHNISLDDLSENLDLLTLDKKGKESVLEEISIINVDIITANKVISKLEEKAEILLSSFIVKTKEDIIEDLDIKE